MDAITKKALVGMLMILKQLADQTYATAEMAIQNLAEAGQRQSLLEDARQSRVGLLRRLDELTHQVDQA